MEQKNESIEDFLKTEEVENLLMIAALGQGDLKSLARQELRARQYLVQHEDPADEYLPHFCVF